MPRSDSAGGKDAGLAAALDAGETVLPDATPAEVVPGSQLLLPAWRRPGRESRTRGFGLAPKIGLVIFAVLLLASVLAPVLPIDDPLAQTLSLRNAGASLHHLLGTDLIGRDVFSRVIYGCRSAFEGVAIAVISMLILGIPWGLAAGFSATVVDEILMRIADAMLSFPALILAIGVVSALGPSMVHSMVAVGVISSPAIARLLRSAALPVRGAQFVLIAGSLGVSRFRIAVRHVLPNAMAPVLVQTFAVASYFLIIEAALGFLGLGVPPPAPSWGQDMANAYLNFTANPSATIAPGLAITTGAWSISTIGDGLRSVLVRA
jgi:peptide/nickel transport system permease protein